MEKSKLHIFSTFSFKLIAIIAMTFDHIGKCIYLFILKAPKELDIGQPLGMTSYIFQIIGRLALPLIAISFAEAMRYSKSREDYMKRLGIVAMLIVIVEVIFRYAMNIGIGSNIFLTLLCAASFIYFYESKGKMKSLCIIPAAFILVNLVSKLTNDFLPIYLEADYDLYGFILMVGFYFLYRLSDYRITTLMEGRNKSIEELRQYPYYRSFTNLMWIALLIVLNVFCWILSMQGSRLDIYGMSIQSYSLVTVLLIFFYSGRKGYKSEKIKYAFYFYYPLHLIIIVLAFFLTFGVPKI